MFSVSFVLFFIALGVLLVVLGKRQSVEEYNKFIYFGWSIVSLVIALVWVTSAFMGPYTNQLNDFASVRNTQEQIKLYSDRRDNLVVVVRTELAKYPEYEKKIMGEIKPSIILSFPVLKSNETITKTVEEIVKLEDAVYKLRANLLVIQTNIFSREISPWVLYVPSYQNFFGEKNLVAK